MGVLSSRATGAWDMIECRFEPAGATAQVFNFELAIYGTESIPGFVLRGDGLLFSDGRVRFNREDELRDMIGMGGDSAQAVLESIAAGLRSRSRQPLRATA